MNFCNLYFAFLILLFSIQSYSQQTSYVIPEQTLRISSGSSASTNLNFSRAPSELANNYQYKLIIKNGDGEIHNIPSTQTCSSYSLIPRLICLAQRVINQLYISIARVQSAQVILNGQSLVSSNNFNSSVNILEIPITNIALSNILSIQISGSRYSYINLAVVSIFSPQLDQIAPEITHNIKSNYYATSLPTNISFNIYTNEPLSQIQINSQPLTLDETGHFYVYNTTVSEAGPITFNVTAQDMAGNFTNLQLQSNTIVDNISPSIDLGEVPLVVISSTYLLTVSIEEENTVSTYITINDEVIGPFSEKDFSYLIEFSPNELKNIQITSDDGASNRHIRSFQIRYVSDQLSAQIVSPLANTSVNSQLVDIQVSANRPIAMITANNISYAISPNRLTASIAVQLYSDGKYTIPLTITDTFGESFALNTQFQIKTNSIATWNYLECPAE